ncbi:MAG: FAD:protein FMN transferase [Hyphomicrobiaceae bacterium]
MQLTRRRFLVAAFATGLAGGGGSLIATGDPRPAHQWRGAALGGEARIALYGASAEEARAALTAATAEIERLETIFSLHRSDSELSRLNRDGRLAAPSRDLVECLRAALVWRDQTGGLFDPTIQPLWTLAASGGTPSPDMLARVGCPVALGSDSITLPRGAEITLNGIAQGRIADRITELLVAARFTDVVIDTGELRLPGRTRRAVGIPAAGSAVSVAEVAIATSEPKSLVFDARSFRHHLIDPRTGTSPRHWQSISVFAPTAETADALSTAFALMHHAQVADHVTKFNNIAVLGADACGRIRRFGNLKIAGLSNARS